jgi:hypothetical protein
VVAQAGGLALFPWSFAARLPSIVEPAVAIPAASSLLPVEPEGAAQTAAVSVVRPAIAPARESE